jgi:hypothetical protein
MRIFPPITIIALLTASLAVVRWSVPPTAEPSRVTVSLTAATFGQPQRRMQEGAHADGRRRTVDHIIEEALTRR